MTAVSALLPMADSRCFVLRTCVFFRFFRQHICFFLFAGPGPDAHTRQVPGLFVFPHIQKKRGALFFLLANQVGGLR